jgi:2-C-methyl-D-erythritol 4-phosphate cytidylyltransferase
MIYGVILAGGIGSRMENATLPKQFIALSGKPIIIHTLLRMLEIVEFDHVYIAIHIEWKEYLIKILNNHNITDERIQIVHGGINRIDSIYNVVRNIEINRKINKTDIVVFHDAVRPFVSTQILHNSIIGARKYGAVVATFPAVDTIYTSNDGSIITNMPNRHLLYHGQAPDSFNLNLFKEAINNLTDDEKKNITGTSQICLLKGIPVYMITGDARNLKITTNSDMEIAHALLRMVYSESNEPVF